MEQTTPQGNHRSDPRVALESNRGTHAMEGLTPDPPTLALMERHARGELTIEQLSAALDEHAQPSWPRIARWPEPPKSAEIPASPPIRIPKPVIRACAIDSA